MSVRRHALIALLAAILILALDQGTKAWAQASLSPGREITVIPGWVWFRLAANTGATLGLFAGQNAVVGAASVVIVAALALLALKWRPADAAGTVALGVIAGGAASNLIDRVRLGGVTDFIEVHLWPTDFNLADAAIRLGVLAYLGTLLWETIRRRRRSSPD